MATPLVDRSPAMLAQQKWRSSGITDALAERLGFEPLEAAQTAALAPNFPAVRSLKIPYWSFDGSPSSFYRVRYLEQIPGFLGLLEKPPRYGQPGKTLNEIYLPNVLDWEEIRTKTSEQIYITEGEFKAACACIHGLPTIGLGGVDVWKATKREIPFLPQLEQIDWKNRGVVICFDSDAANKPDVVRAQLNLSRELVARGALVTIASLPPADDGSKQGLDDFIVAKGVDSLSEILEAAPSTPECSALWDMNAELTYITDPGMVVVKESGRVMKTDKFVKEIYANRHYMEITMSGGKNPVPVAKKKPLASRWVEWEHRHELDRVVYAPGQSKIVNNSLNNWPGWGCEPKRGDVKPWKDLMTFIFRSDPKQRKWFEQWCAYPIQHPGAKLYTSAVLWGNTKRTGKTLVGYCLGKIYGSNFIEVAAKDLTKDFNAWQERKQLVLGDEISGGMRREQADYMKKLITQAIIKINQKYAPEYLIDDCINYLLSSNHADAIFLEDGDQRYWIHEVIGPPESREFYDRIDAWYKSPEGPSALFHYLLNIDLDGFHPFGHAPDTAAKQQMTLHSKGDVGYWVQQLIDDPVTCMRGVFSDRARNGLDLWTPRLLLRAADPEGKKRISEPMLGRAMTAANLRQINHGLPVRTKMGILRLYAIRNQDQWHKATPKACAEHYESFMDDLTKF